MVSKQDCNSTDETQSSCYIVYNFVSLANKAIVTPVDDCDCKINVIIKIDKSNCASMTPFGTLLKTGHRSDFEEPISTYWKRPTGKNAIIVITVDRNLLGI
jgi:hypothetical protein